MAYFALLWKARTIEKYRLRYEKEKINSIVAANVELPRHTFYQKWKLYRYESQNKLSRIYRRLCPEGSRISNFFVYLTTDQTFSNFLVKSVIGFVGGIVLTYFWFMFFVFQLSISLIHATIMSSVIGVALTLGLAFSYRIRCLVFLLIPQFFSRVGRYTLTCYALVLILTGPATNTLKNSEVLSESLACGQEQVKSSLSKVSESVDRPMHLVKDTISFTVKKLKYLATKFKEMIVEVHRLTMSIAHVLQSSLTWLNSIERICNTKLGTPYEHCTRTLNQGLNDCRKLPNKKRNLDHFVQAICFNVKDVDKMCVVGDFAKGSIVATVKKKLTTYSSHMQSMLHVGVHVKRSHSYCGNTSRTASQAAAGIVTEMRTRADPILTWLSWSSCLTSLFLLLIIFRAKYYQQMFETRSRFDNRYVTKELRDLDLKRLRQGRETVLPLNTRERAKYVSTTSFHLLASERVHLTRSIVFMVITTFKLLIHMVADYSLYWVLMNIRFHGRFQTVLQPGDPTAGVEVSGSGPLAAIVRVLVEALSVPLSLPSAFPISCLPNPHPPDFQRYAQIGILILLLWFFALFEPYGLRLRHVIMGHYQPERARARAAWLYNHIIRTRGCFLKYARRKLHREYKYSTEERLTFKRWLKDIIPCYWLRYLLRIGTDKPHCVLCNTRQQQNDPDTYLRRCETPSCPGVYCARCFTDIGQLCTICLSPKDYGDFSDISLEKSSSEDSNSDDSDDERGADNGPITRVSGTSGDKNAARKDTKKNNRRIMFSRAEHKDKNADAIAFLKSDNFHIGKTANYVPSSNLDTETKTEYKDTHGHGQINNEMFHKNETTKHSQDNATVPVLVRDGERVFKCVEIPKSKLTGIANTIALLTAKMDDGNCNQKWNTHDSQTFEYLVMELFQPLDTFKKALIVRHAKHYDLDKVTLNNVDKNESVKHVVSFLSSYPLKNNISNNTFSTRLKVANLNKHVTLTDVDKIPCYKIQSINKSRNHSKRVRNLKYFKKNLQRYLKIKAIITEEIINRLRKRRIHFNKKSFIAKRQKRCYKPHKNLNLKNKCIFKRFNGGMYSFSGRPKIKAKHRTYNVNRDTLSKSLLIGRKVNIKRKGKKETKNSKSNLQTECFVKDITLNSKTQELPLDNYTQVHGNKITVCSSDVNSPEIKVLPRVTEESHNIKNNETRHDNLAEVVKLKIEENPCKYKICGFCFRLWKRTKLSVMSPKLMICSKTDDQASEDVTNHKRRKKTQLSEQINDKNVAKQQAKKINDDARNYRISLFLKEQEWFKRQFHRETEVPKKNDDPDKEIPKTLLILKQKEDRRKQKEEEILRKAVRKNCIKELKLKAKAEEKLKKMQKKGIMAQKNIKRQNTFNIQNVKHNTKTAEKEILACVLNPVNFNGLKNPSLVLPEGELDLDKILNDRRALYDEDIQENSDSTWFQNDIEKNHRPLLWPYEQSDTTQMCFDKVFKKKNVQNVVETNKKEATMKHQVKQKKSLKSVLSEMYTGVKMPVEKIRSLCSTFRVGSQKFETPKETPKTTYYVDKVTHARPFTKTRSCQDLNEISNKDVKTKTMMVKNCDTQCDSDKCYCGDHDVGLMTENATCTCAVQYSLRCPGKINVGTIHHNALKKMHNTAIQYEQPKTYTDDEESTASSIVLAKCSDSEDNQSDRTVCSRVTIHYAVEKPQIKDKSKRIRVKVVTKANQSTETERNDVVDVSTITSDWWSPLVEKKDIKLEEKAGDWAMNLKKDANEQRRGKFRKGFVSFKSRPQLIPTKPVDILSPSRYLLESQKYYNELYTSHIPHAFSATSLQKFNDGDKTANKTRRGHKSHRTKRLEESYSPRKRTQTSNVNLRPVNWRPADKSDKNEGVPSQTVMHYRRKRNAKLQTTQSKSRIKDKDREKRMCRAYQKNERVQVSRSFTCYDDNGTVDAQCNSSSY